MFLNPVFRVVLASLLIAIPFAGAAPFKQVVTAEGFHDPMSIAVAPGGDVFVVEREGRIYRINPVSGGRFEIGNLQVSALRSNDPKSDFAVEEGLQGIALDPNFADNQRIYLFYSHPDAVVDRLARFQLKDGLFDRSSELVLIDIPIERNERVCHHGGSVQFGPDGLLYLTVGDNTNPFASDGYAPIDNRPERKSWDAARTSGNTDDLRGKILRIRPTEKGYEIPPGNLFPKGTPKTRPEIFVMGCRNPFRSSIDPKTSTLYWGEVGPDAGHESAKGPAGHDEINQARKAGNFGWPFMVANNKPYPIVDFSTGAVIRATDPARPVNDLARNTGLTELPPGQSAFIWYPYADSVEFPVMDKGGRNAMAGPVFYYDPSRKFNILGKEYDHTLLTYDWMRGKIWTAKLGAEEKLEKLELLADQLRHPMDLEMAADGSLWLLDYGSEWWFNKNGKLIHLLPGSKDQQGAEVVLTISPVDDKRTGFVASGAQENSAISWWISTNAGEQPVGNGASVQLPENVEATEIRAVVSEDGVTQAIARFPLGAVASFSELRLVLKDDPKAAGFGQTVAFKITGNELPKPEQVIVRARYIPATGHDSGGPRLLPEIAALVTANQCLACHQVDQPSVGPAYTNVSLKYRGDPQAKTKLMAKLKSGGAGVWGEVPMPPQSALNDADAEMILDAVLGLSDGVTETKSTLEGNLTLASKPANSGEGGAWEFSAEAPGFQSAKFRIPAL